VAAQVELDVTDLSEIRRREFPITDAWVYFDSATYGPHPRRYVQAMSEVASRLSTDLLGTASSAIDGVRSAAARLLGAPEGNVALLRSTGEGTNLVTGGLDWKAGDEVILYELDFPSLIAPWLGLAEQGVRVAVVEDRGRHRFEVEDVERLLSPRTRAISVSLVNNTTGFRAPVEALAELCRARGLWFTVDAVQAIGSVYVDVPALQADVVTAHGYKFQLSGFGYALAYLSDRAIAELDVPHVGMQNLQPSGDGQTLFQSGLQMYPTARRFEPSTPNLPAILAMGASLELLLETGLDRIDTHNRHLCRRLVEGLSDKGYVVVTSQGAGESAGIVCATRPLVEPESIREHLAGRHIVCAVRGGRLRFAPHLFNTLDDVEQLIAALP
jgi:cysteine desulfurase/selenocysteine lyase